MIESLSREIAPDPGEQSDTAHEAHAGAAGPGSDDGEGAFDDLMDAFRAYGEGQRELMFEIRRASELLEDGVIW